MHVFKYIRELDSFAAVVDRAVGEGQVRAMMGVHILRLQSLVAVPIGGPGTVVTHLDEFCHNKNIQDNDEIEENTEIPKRECSYLHSVSLTCRIVQCTPVCINKALTMVLFECNV